MPQYNLQAYGFATSVNIGGLLSQLRYIPSTPVVFLFDEHHTTSACIAENIANGDALRTIATISLVGVESHAEGVVPNGGVGNNSNAYNTHPEFGNHFAAVISHVYGIEETVIAARIEDDVNNGDWPNGRERTHPYNTLRSYHYVATLFRLYREHNLSGHIFLNAGREHIEHIAAMIRGGVIDDIAGQQASYIRLCAASYPMG